jgi:hypothetical protein
MYEFSSFAMDFYTHDGNTYYLKPVFNNVEKNGGNPLDYTYLSKSFDSTKVNICT